MNPNTVQTLCQVGMGFSLILLAVCTFGNYWYGKQADQAKPKSVKNESIGFELKAKRSEIEGNIAMDHQKGFKVEMEDSTFKRNVSKGRNSSIKEQSKEAKNPALKGVTNQNDKKVKIVGNVIIDAINIRN